MLKLDAAPADADASAHSDQLRKMTDKSLSIGASIPERHLARQSHSNYDDDVHHADDDDELPAALVGLYNYHEASYKGRPTTTSLSFIAGPAARAAPLSAKFTPRVMQTTRARSIIDDGGDLSRAQPNDFRLRLGRKLAIKSAQLEKRQRRLLQMKINLET